MHIAIMQFDGLRVKIPLTNTTPQPGDCLDDGDRQMVEAIAKALSENNYMAAGYYDVELVGNHGEVLDSETLVL